MIIVVTDSGNFREWKQSGEPFTGDRVLVGRSSERVEVVCPGQWDSVEHFWDWFVGVGRQAKAQIVAEQRPAILARRFRPTVSSRSPQLLAAAR
ncbi:MAG TPA: hypothetical protein VGO93_29050 [Candidatus Xenobia bacterium]